MKKFISIVLLSMLIGCASTNPPIPTPEQARQTQINACLPNAIMMTEGLKKANIDAKVLSLETPSFGHAVCVYMYPKGKNKMWVWDADWKSIQIRAYADSPEAIAKTWLVKIGNWNPLVSASFLE